MIWLVALAGAGAIIHLLFRVGGLKGDLDDLRQEVSELRESLRSKAVGAPLTPAKPEERPRIEVIRPTPTPRPLVAEKRKEPAANAEKATDAAEVPPPLPGEERAPVRPAESIQVRRPVSTQARTPTAARWGESAGDLIKTKLRALGPSDPDMGWEMALGTYWLPRIGAAAISIAVVFLLTLALQKWGPPVRVTLGYGVCLALLVFAWRLEKKHPAYARVLFGGGFALLYFVTWSTYYVEFARLFDTPYLTLIALGVIVAAWAFVAQRRRSPTIAMLVTVLGHLTIGLATAVEDNPPWISVAGILLLSAGSAFFLLQNRWYYVAAVGLVASYLNHAFILARGDAPDEVGPFALGMGVLAALYLIYALAELFAPEDLRRKTVPIWFRSVFVTVNTAGMLLLGSVLIEAFTFTEDYHYLFRYILAIALLLISLAYYRRRAGDPLHNVYQTKAIAVATLGLASQFSAESLTAWLAVEMVALLYSARRSGMLVTRLLAFVIADIAFVHGFVTAVGMDFLPYDASSYFPTLATVSLTLLGFLAASWLYQHTDWSTRSPAAPWFGADVSRLLWQFDLVAAPSDAAPPSSKPHYGRFYPHLYTAAFLVLFALFSIKLFPLEDRAILTAGVLTALVLGAAVLSSPPFGHAAAVLHLAMVFWVVDYAFETHVPYNDPEFARQALKAALVVLAALFFTEFARRTSRLFHESGRAIFPRGGFIHVARPLHESMYVDSCRDDDSEPLAPFFFAIAAVVCFVSYVFMLLPLDHQIFAFAAGALAFTVLALALNALPFGVAAWPVLALAAFITVDQIVAEAPQWSQIMTLILVAATALLSESRYVPARRGLALHHSVGAPYLLYGTFTVLLGVFFTIDRSAEYSTVALVISAVAAALLILVLHRNALGLASLALYLWAQFAWHVEALTNEALPPAITIVLLLFAIAADRFFSFRGLRWLCPFLLASAWLTAVHWFYLIVPDAWFATVVAALGAGLLVYGLALRSATAVILSLLSAVVASAAQVGASLDEIMPNVPLIAGYLACAGLWVIFERVSGLAVGRFTSGQTLYLSPSGIFVGVASALLVVMLSRVPQLSEFYLTISWSVLAVALFIISIPFGEKWYRYAGLAILLLASMRVVFIDTRALEPMPKVFAWGVLGLVLLALGYGYVKAFARNKPSPPSSANEQL